jgi:excisionase family DNA binding protein
LNEQFQKDEILTISEAAALLKLKNQAVYGYINSGKLRAKRIGLRVLRVSKVDLLNLFEDYIPGEYSIWGKR